MTARGRKPTPSALNKLRGNPGKRAVNKQEPQPPEADVSVPDGLPENATALWRVLAPQLADMGVLKATDLPALELLCVHYSVARDALALLEQDGMTADTREGIKKHPAVSALREHSLAFKSYLTEFGLTPSSRVRLKVEPKREKTLAEMLFEKANAK